MGYFDYLQHGKKMFRKKGELPVYLVYFITDACNAKSKHCLRADGAHPGWEEPSMVYRKQELSLEEVDKVTASMGKGSLMFLLPTGGEPFLREDIGEIVKIFHKNTGVRNVGIPTNGSTTARTVSIVKDLLDSCPDLDLHIDVSLDGVGALHDEIRVFPGLFKRSIETYKALRDVEKHYKNFACRWRPRSQAQRGRADREHDWFRQNLDVDTVFTLLTRRAEGAARSSSTSRSRSTPRTWRRSTSRARFRLRLFPFADFINAKRIVRHRLIAKIVRDNTYQILLRRNLGGALFANGDVYLRAADRPEARQRARRRLRFPKIGSARRPTRRAGSSASRSASARTSAS
jgi:organic radical activating enzyme